MNTETTDIQPQAEPPGQGPPSQEPPGQPPGRRKRSTGKTAAAVVIGAIGVILAAAGAVAIVAHVFVRDDDGYFTKSTELATGSYALTTDKIELDNAGADVPDALVGDLRVRATSADGKPLFLGIAPTAAVNRYLSGVGHRQVSDFDVNGDPSYEGFPGKAPASAPGAHGFWTAQSHGAGQQTINWDLEPGTWTLVAMNADGSRGVALDGDIGAKVDWLIWVGLGLLALGLVSIGGAAALAYSGRPRPV